MTPRGFRDDASLLPAAVLAILAPLLVAPLAGCLNHQRVIVEVPESQATDSSSIAPRYWPASSAGGLAAPPGDPLPERLVTEIDRDVPSRDWRYVVLHHSGGDSGSIDSIDAEHRQRTDDAGHHWLGIGYHFVIGNGRGMPDGAAEATFRWRRQLPGAHAGARPYNETGIGICLIGDFEQSPPTERQLHACLGLVARLCSEYDLRPDDIIRHSDIKATQCPGRRFPLDDLREHVSRSLDSARFPRFRTETAAIGF